jgi:hypothetical protein
MDHPSSQRRLPIERSGEINKPELSTLPLGLFTSHPNELEKTAGKGRNVPAGGELDIADETKHRQLRGCCLLGLASLHAAR